MTCSNTGRPEILTLDEAVTLLKLSDRKPLLYEIQAGRLVTTKIGDEVRIHLADLNQFLEAAKSIPVPTQSEQGRLAMDVHPSAPFKHRWPDNTVEHYKEAYSGSVKTSYGAKNVRIGFTRREAAGKARERSAVFIDNRPLVEFVGADDFESTQVMVSVLKVHGRQVRPIEGPPRSYDDAQIVRYNEHVTGPYASSNLAVCCKKDDLVAMVKHALLRLEDIKSRQ